MCRITREKDSTDLETCCQYNKSWITFCILADCAPGHDEIDCDFNRVVTNRGAEVLFCFFIGNAVGGVSGFFGSLFACCEDYEEPRLSISVDAAEASDILVIDVNDTIVFLVDESEYIRLVVSHLDMGVTWK